VSAKGGAAPKALHGPKRARAKRAVPEQETCYRRFAAHFPGVIYRSYLNKRGGILLLSKTATSITGQTMEALARKRDFPLHSLIVRRDRQRRQKSIADAVENNAHFELEYQIRRKDGKVRHVLEYGVPIRDGEGMPSHIDGVILDITDRRRLEEKLNALEAALRTVSIRFFSLQEMERRRISRDLHDGIGQILASIKMRVESAALLISRKQARPASKTLSAIIPMIQQAMDEVRRISTDLRPSILDDLGITATINWFCRNFAETYAVRVETDLAIEESAIPEALKTVVYRVLQEAMNNVAKHARADHVRVSFRRIDRTVELMIDDNGHGFDVQQALSAGALSRGLGLPSMQERVKMSGGSFSLTSARKVGTVVQAAWPLDRASSRAVAHK
jgi:PAS domain S-box-containing protein